MKKFLFILLAAAMTLPVMAQVSPALRDRGAKVSRELDTRVLKTVKAFDGTYSTPMRAEANYVWDFENDADFEGWSMYDADGDGYCWEIEDYYSFSGVQSVTSRSYYGGQALFPDNWLISPNVALGGELKFYAENYLTYYPDQIQVFLILGDELTLDAIDAAVPVSDMIVPSGDWTEYTIDLSAYSGMGFFAIRHYDCSDQFRVLVDYVTLSAPAVTKPQNVVATPAATSAVVEWDDAENVAWNLRYRETVDVESIEWDFENEEQMAVWELVDADGDGNNWTYFNMTGVSTGRWTPHSGEGLVSSASYDNDASVALTPDNWMISPKVKLDGTLSFWAAGQDPSYAAEVFGVFVSTDKVNWTQIGEDITATGTYTEYTFDLSSRAGEEGYFAIRHYNVTDQFWLNIDDIALSYGKLNEWIVVEGVTSPYTIEGLNPETMYDVEVQGVNADGFASGWTQTVVFTTLPGDVPPVYEETCAAPNGEYIIIDKEKALVTITNNEPGATVHYVVTLDGVVMEEGDFTGDTWEYIAVGPGAWLVSCVASLPGKNDSNPGGVFFPIAPGQQPVAVDEMMAGKTISSVRYYNAAGQEMQEANGLTIVVTTYTDGTTNAVKVVK